MIVNEFEPILNTNKIYNEGTKNFEELLSKLVEKYGQSYQEIYDRLQRGEDFLLEGTLIYEYHLPKLE